MPPPAEGGDLFNPSVSRDGRIVVEEVDQDRDVWRADLAHGRAAPFIRSTSDDYDPTYDQAAGRLAFVSERSGAPEIWIHSPGEEARRLTRLAGPDIRQISWSADGTRLAFLAEENGAAGIYAATIGSGEPVRLPGSGQGRIPIGWTAAADALFILAPAGRHWRLEELSLAGRKSRPIAAPSLRLAALAADGRSIFAIPSGENKLLRLVPGKGVVRQFRLPPSPSLTRPIALLPAADSLYLVEDALGSALVHRLDLRSGTVAPAVRLEDYRGGALSLAPDGRSVAYTRARETANDLAWTKL